VYGVRQLLVDWCMPAASWIPPPFVRYHPSLGR